MSTYENSEPTNTRWWESYLVRYFLGFIVGTLCVIALIGITSPKQAPSLLGDAAGFFGKNQTTSPSTESSFTSASAIGIALLGLAFCYIASTPITVIHAARMYRSWWERQTRTFWLGWSATLFICALGAGVGISFWFATLFLISGLSILLLVDPFYFLQSQKTLKPESPPSSTTPKLWQVFHTTPPIQSKPETSRLGRTTWGFFLNSVAWALFQFGICAATSNWLPVNTNISPVAIAFSLPTIWICIVQYNCLIQILTQPATFTDWYRRISRARIQQGTRDIRETYTHLREHANSVFIVVIELSIFALLIVAAQLSSNFQSSTSSSIEFKYLAAAFIGIWLTPTIFMWSRANWLEQEFADQPEHFITNSNDPGS